ncbi:MAG TPA: sugar ABC transporter substrate-binding protein [Casimicrobiaceae bacterium]
MRAMHGSHPFARSTARPCSWWQRVADLIAALALLVAVTPMALAQPVEIVYNTFSDPNNANDPRAIAQTKMIAEFERQNPNIKVRVVVDPTGANGARTLRIRADSPDVIRATNFQMPEYVATGSLLQLDDLVKGDKIDQNDWLVPLAAGMVGGHVFGLQQDYRIPILIYRKQLLDAAKVTPPRTWDDVCTAGAKLSKGNVAGYAIPIGTTGGIGGAQAFGEFHLSTMLSAPDGKYFAADNRAIAFSKDAFIRGAQVIKDQFVKCKSTPMASLQYGYNEVHDGLRAGTVAMATFGLYRYRGIQAQGAGEDLAWAPAPGLRPDEPQAVYGFQLTINAFSKQKEAAWQFVKFMTSPAAQAIAAQGGEVVARASAYNDPYFASPQGRDQRAWAELIKVRGRQVNYSIIQTAFHQIVADAFQRMVLRNGTPEEAYQEVVGKYNEALAKTP